MASSSSSTLQPASFGGYGRQTGIYGGLQGVEFAARCPPDVQKNTRIIAVCGVPDYEVAAPDQDGWFFSDFFLFYQMLSSRRELPNQLWLTSCSPRQLIRQHGRYLHGPANGVTGDRRVVMDEAMLPDDEMAAGFRVFPKNILLERFLATLKDEIQEAAKSKQPVLVFIFGHGEKKTSGIFIGCNQTRTANLTQARLCSVLRKDVQTTMILTSCYSGGWIMQPNFNHHFDVKPAFNHSFLTAANSKTPSLSWSLSQSVGRQAGGSVFATCLLNSIITASDSTEYFYSREPVNSEESSNNGQHPGEMGGKLIKVQEDDEGEEIGMTPTMAALTQQIMYQCEARCGSLWDEHTFRFAVQDDHWAEAWGKRTGLPILEYKRTWESLPVAHSKTEVYPTAGPLKGSIMSKHPNALSNIVRVKAATYMASHPGPDNGGCNTNCHPGFRKLVEGASLTFDKFYYLNNILDFRQGQIGLAEVYYELLEIGVAKDRQVDQFDETEWMHSQLIAKHEGSAESSKAATDLLKKYDTVHGLVIRSQIFDSPCHSGDFDQGYDYTKPEVYLAVKLAESPRSLQQIQENLERLVQHKLEDARCAARSPLGVAILNQVEVKTMRGRLYETVGKLTHRLRSMSPQKKSSRMEGRG